MFRVLLFSAGLFLNVQSFSQDTTRLSLLFVGDIMQHDSNIAAAYNPLSARYDYTSCFEYVAPILKSADLTIGNLELTLAGKPYKGYPQFSAPNELAYELKRVGFDAGSASPMMSAHAFYRRAKALGVQFRFNERATGIIRRRGRVVGVRTDKGGYASPVVINAGGAWARSIAQMGGLDVAVVPDSHEAGVTDPGLCW